MGFVSNAKDKLKFKIALLKNEMDPMSLLFLVVVVIFFSAFLILPLLSIIAAAFKVNDELMLDPIFDSMSALLTYNFSNSALYYYFGAFLTFMTIHSYNSVNQANQRIYSHMNINRNPKSPQAILGVLLSVRALLIVLLWYILSLMATSADETSIYSLISGIIMAVSIMVIFYFWNNSRKTDQKVTGISIKEVLKYQIFMVIFYIIVQLGLLMIEKSYYNNIIGDTEILVIATEITSFLTIILTVILLLILHLFRKRKQLSNKNFSKLLKSSFDQIFTRLILILFLVLPFMTFSQDSFMKWFNDWIIKTDGKTLFDLLPITFFGSIFDALNTLSFDFFIQVFTNQNATYLEMDQNAIFSLLGFILVFLFYRSYRSQVMQEDNVIKAYFEMNHVKRSIISTIYLSVLILFLAVIDIYINDLIPINVDFGILYLIAVILLAMAYESKIINIEGTLGYFYLPLNCIFTLITIAIVYALSGAIQVGFPIAAQNVIDQGADPSTVIIYKTLDSFLVGVILGCLFVLTVIAIGLIISRFKTVKFEELLSVDQFASNIEFLLLSIILVLILWFGCTFLGQAYPVIQWGNGVIPFEIYLFILITIIFAAITIAKRLLSPHYPSSNYLLYITILLLIGILGIVYIEPFGFLSILTGGNRIISPSLANVLNMMIVGLIVIYIVFSAIKRFVEKYADDNLRIFHLLRLVSITLIGILFSTALALHWGFFNGLLVAIVFLIQAILQGSDLPVETQKEISFPLNKSKESKTKFGIISMLLLWLGGTFIGLAYPVIQLGNGLILFQIFLFIVIILIIAAIISINYLLSPSIPSSKIFLYVVIPVIYGIMILGILGFVFIESYGYLQIITGGNITIVPSLAEILNMMLGGLLVLYIMFSAIKLFVDKNSGDNLRIYHLLRLVFIILIGIFFSTVLALYWDLLYGLLVALVFLIQTIFQGLDLLNEIKNKEGVPLIKSKIKLDYSIINFIKIIIALIITLVVTYTIEFLADDLFQSLAKGKIVFLSKYTFSNLNIPFIGNISLNLITLALFVCFIFLMVYQIVSARSQGSLGNGTQITIILSKLIILTVIATPFIVVNINEFLNWDIQFVRISADQSELVLSGLSSSTLVSTLFVGLGTTLVSTIIGVALAFVIARYEFSGKNLLRVLILFPLVIPPFVGAIGARRILLDQYSSLNLWLSQQLELIPWAITFQGLLAVILVQSIHFYTLVYLNSLSSFLNIDPSLEESAENLGSSGFHLFRTITLPLATPGIAAGAVLTFILSVEDLGTPLIFYGDEQIKELLTFKVWDNLQGLTGSISGPILALGVILLIIAMSGFAVIRKYVSLREYSMISKGGTFSDRSRAISKGATLLVWSLTLILLCFALIPHIGTILLSIHNPTQGVWSSTRDVIPKVITFEFLFSSFGDTIRSLIFPTGWLISFIALILIYYLNKNYIKKKVISTWNSILFGLTIPVLVILFSFDDNLKGIFPREFYISTGETITGILRGFGEFSGEIKLLLTDFGGNYLDLIFITSIIISLILITLLFKTTLKKFKTLTLDDKSIFIAQLLIASVLLLITIFAAYDKDVLLNLVFAIILIILGYYFSKKYFDSFWNKFAALGVFILMGSIGLWYDIFDFVEINLPYYDVSSAYEETILRTMILSFVAIIAIVILGVAAAYILARKNFPGKVLLDTLVTSPIALPGVVIGLGYMSFFVKITSASIMVEGFSFEPFFGFGLFYLIHFALIISFTIRRFPFTVRSAYAGLLQTHETFEEVSKNLGASQTETLKRVTLPLIAANIFGGAMISFVYSLGEVSTSMILLGTEGQATIPWLIRSLYNTGFSYVHYAAALGMILLVLQLIVITVSNSILKRTGSAVTGI